MLVALLAAACLWPGAAAFGQSKIACGEDYTVRPGDTLRTIAIRTYGSDDYSRLWAENRRRIGRNPNNIARGMRLRVPCFEATGPRVRRNEGEPDIGQANVEPAPELATADIRATADPQPSVRIVFNKAAAPDFILNVGIIDPLLADIERATEGRVTFMEPETVNRDPQAQLQLVRSGQVDGAYIFNGHLADTHPLVQITMHPMTGGTALQTATALWRVYQQHFVVADSFGDVKLLGFVGAPPAHIWRVSDAPVDEREQLINNNAWAVPYFDGLDTRGADAFQAENAERIRRLDQTPGVPPATFAIAHGAARAAGVWTGSRMVTEIDGGVYAPTFSVFISRAKWNEIGEADRRAIERLTGEALALRSAAWDAFDNQHKAAMLEDGLKLQRADFDVLAELQDRARVSWEVWIRAADAQGISGYEALEAYFREMKQLRRDFPG